MKISPRSSRTNPQSDRIFLVGSGTWILPLMPVVSMRLARFTVIPQMSYCGLAAPITPATTGPCAIPVWQQINIGRLVLSNKKAYKRIIQWSPEIWELKPQHCQATIVGFLSKPLNLTSAPSSHMDSVSQQPLWPPNETSTSYHFTALLISLSPHYCLLFVFHLALVKHWFFFIYCWVVCIFLPCLSDILGFTCLLGLFFTLLFCWIMICIAVFGLLINASCFYVILQLCSVKRYSIYSRGAASSLIRAS